MRSSQNYRHGFVCEIILILKQSKFSVDNQYDLIYKVTASTIKEFQIMKIPKKY